MPSFEILKDAVVRKRHLVYRALGTELPELPLSAYERRGRVFQPEQANIALVWETGRSPEYSVIVTGPVRGRANTLHSRTYRSGEELPEWLEAIVRDQFRATSMSVP